VLLEVGRENKKHEKDMADNINSGFFYLHVFA
jgi:hypothetical protein